MIQGSDAEVKNAVHWRQCLFRHSRIVHLFYLKVFIRHLSIQVETNEWRFRLIFGRSIQCWYLTHARHVGYHHGGGNIFIVGQFLLHLQKLLTHVKRCFRRPRITIFLILQLLHSGRHHLTCFIILLSHPVIGNYISGRTLVQTGSPCLLVCLLNLPLFLLQYRLGDLRLICLHFVNHVNYLSPFETSIVMAEYFGWEGLPASVYLNLLCRLPFRYSTATCYYVRLFNRPQNLPRGRILARPWSPVRRMGENVSTGG